VGLDDDVEVHYDPLVVLIIPRPTHLLHNHHHTPLTSFIVNNKAGPENKKNHKIYCIIILQPRVLKSHGFQ